MNLSSGSSFNSRRKRQWKEIGVILAVLTFYGIYRIPPVQNILDRLVVPAVAGVSLGYGKISSWIYRLTGFNFGFVAIPPDPEFLFSVQLATYINQKLAPPLLDLASDARLPLDKRERALRSLTKFESTADWVQPFLNELPKGGLLGLYDEKAPLLDELVKKIRSEGGIRQDLVRAYAEVVFSFMLQVPDSVVRKHALSWVSDIISENALFLIIPRFERESDPDVQKAIDAALFDIRAVSEPKKAMSLLVPYYQKPPWPSLRLPLAVLLSRLGYDSSVDFLRFTLKSKDLTADEQVTLRVALAQTPYPTKLAISEKDQKLMAQRARNREAQHKEAWAKYERNERQEWLKHVTLAKAMEETPQRSRVQAPPEEPEEDIREEEPLEREPEERDGTVFEEKEDVPVVSMADSSTGESSAPPVTTAQKKVSEKSAAVLAYEEEIRQIREARKREEKTPPAAFPPTSRENSQTQTIEKPNGPPPPSSGREAFEQSAPASNREIPPSMEKSEKLSQAKETPEEDISAHETPPQYAKLTEPTRGLPEEMLPPPIEDRAAPPKSLMNYIDGIFEVKKPDTVIYENPGSGATKVTLPVGMKGKADLEVLIGEDHWYQVRTKAGNGWVNGSALSVFNLSPSESVPATAGQSTPAAKPLEGEREESTYFEASAPDVPIYLKPGHRAKKVGTLAEEVAYLAVKSEKVGEDRWFQLQIRSGETAWVKGMDLKLASVQQPGQLNIPTQALSLRNAKSAFSAEWAVASVKGVGVYSRPSIAGKLINTIEPPTVYKILELSSGSGKEWYRIELPGKKEGWVQALDVSLTKPN